MKRLLMALLLVLPVSAWAVPASEPAPAVRGARLIGEGELSLSSLRGQVVLVDFFASWCGPCAQSLPVLQALRAELQSQYPQRFEVLAVNVDDTAAEGREFLQRKAPQLPAIFDAEGRIASVWALPGMPSSFVIDVEGRIAARHTGFRAGDEAKWRAEILPLLGKTPPGR